MGKIFCEISVVITGMGTAVAHTRLPSVGFRSWSRFLAVSLQVTWVINPAVGCHYFPPGLQLPSQPCCQFHCLGVNSLPKTVTRQHCNCDLNPGPSAPESSTLTMWLPNHPWSKCKQVKWLVVAVCGRIFTTSMRSKRSVAMMRTRTATSLHCISTTLWRASKGTCSPDSSVKTLSRSDSAAAHVVSLLLLTFFTKCHKKSDNPG